MKSILFLATLLLSLNVTAQFTLRGKVLSDSKEPLAGALVRIEGSSKGVYTDNYGSYELKKVQAGSNVLEVSFIGFKPWTVELDVKSDQRLFDISLEESVTKLGQVVVKATRAGDNTPMAQSKITFAELEKQNLGQDLPILLQNEVSLVTTSDAGAGIGYTGFRLRGSDASRINVTVNGIPLNDSESQGVFWVNMPDFTSSVESIQIQRGVGTSTNGAGAFGGSVNLETNTLKEKAYAEASTTFGSFNTQKYSLKTGTGLLADHWSIDARASMIKSDGYIDRASSNLRSYYLSGAYYGDKTVVKLIHFSGRETTYQSWWGTPQSRLSGDVDAMNAHAGNNGLDSAQTANLVNSGRTYNFYEYDNEVDNYGQDHYQLHFAQELGSNLTANAALHYTKGNGYYEQFRKDDSFSDYGLSDLIIGVDTITSTDLIRRRWLDNDFYGMTYSFILDREKLDFTFGGAYNIYEGDHFGEIIWSEFANGSDIRDRYYDNVGNKTEFNTYAKLNYQLSDKMQGFADLQVRSVDYSTSGIDNNLAVLAIDTSFTFVNPKAGLTYQISDSLSVFVSVAVGNREPVRNDFIDNPRSNQPSHETLLDYELGLHYTGNKYDFNANVYYMDYTNQLVLTGALNDVGSNIRTNVADSYRAGIELKLNYNITKKLNLMTNASFSQNKIKDFTETVYDYTKDYDIIENNYTDTDIAFSPNLIAAAGAEYQVLKGLSLMVQTKYVGKQYLDNTSSDAKSIDAYQTVDARLSYAVFPKKTKSLTVNVLVNNLLNTMYSSNGYTYSYIWGNTITENFYYPQAGTNFLVGATLKL
jgi:iron complex outermembrane receptor protein